MCWARGAQRGVTGRSVLEGRRQVSSAAVTDKASSTPREVDLSVQGMTCASCAARVEKKLNSMDDVSATVNFAAETATITAPPSVPVRRLIEAVEQAGYGAAVLADAAARANGEGPAGAAPGGPDADVVLWGVEHLGQAPGKLIGVMRVVDHEPFTGRPEKFAGAVGARSGAVLPVALRRG